MKWPKNLKQKLFMNKKKIAVIFTAFAVSLLAYQYHAPTINQITRAPDTSTSAPKRYVVTDYQDVHDPDDSGMIARALQAMKSNGLEPSELYFPPKTYKVSQSFVVEGSNITIDGDLDSNGSPKTKIIKVLTNNSSAAQIFHIINSKNIVISNLEFDGGYTGPSTGSNPVIQIGTTGSSNTVYNREIEIKHC